MKTMTHTDAQRKAWRNGKRRGWESRWSWFRRVIIEDRNFRGAYTPPRFRLYYKALNSGEQ